MRRTRTTGSLLLAALAGLAAAADAPRSATERLRDDVARLAADEWQGRRAGTPEADRAADWIAGEFRRIGLAPVAPGGSYFQPFTFIDGVELRPGNRLSTLAGGSSTAWQVGQDFRPLAFSAPGTAAGEVVFAGYGIVAKDLGHDDYEAIDVRGRIVLLLRHGPDGDAPQSRWAAFTSLRQKASTARDKGAAAALFVLGPRTRGEELVPLRGDASLVDGGLPLLSVSRKVAEALLAGSGTSLEAAQRRLDEAVHAAPAPVVPLKGD